MRLYFTRRRLALSALLAVVGLILAVWAVFLYREGLDRANQWMSLVAGFAAIVALVLSGLAPWRGSEPARSPRTGVLLSTAWGPRRVRDDVLALIRSQARAAQSLPYRLPGIEGVPMRTMYVAQQLEPHVPRPVETAADRAPVAGERIEARGRDQVRLRILPMGQPVERALDRHRHLLVEGGPGLGKSSLARDLTMRLADAWLAPGADRPPIDAPVLPLLISARALARHRDLPWPAALSRAWGDDLGQHADSVPSDDVLSSPPAGVNWLVIVDGLDEVAEPQREELLSVLAGRMAQSGSTFRIVVMSRPVAGTVRRRLQDGDAGVYSLLPLSRAALADFVVAAFGVIGKDDASLRAEQFLDQLSTSDLDEVARVPLLAAIAVTVFAAQPQRGLPRTRFELYEQYIGHLAEAGTARKRLLHTRLRTRFGTSIGLADLKTFFDRCDELVEYLAVRQVESEERLIDAAMRWCDLGNHLPCVAGPALAETLIEILTGTGMLVRRERDLAFVHHSFAEHFAAGYHARQLLGSFDIREDPWPAWVGQAIANNDMARAVLVRWTRLHPATALLEWLQDGSASYQGVAIELIAAGAVATEAQTLRALQHVRSVSAWQVWRDDLLKLARQFPCSTAVQAWARNVLDGATDNPHLQALAAHLLSDPTSPHHRHALTVTRSRLREGLLPDQCIALATALAAIAPGLRAESAAALRRVVTDPRTPAQYRTAAAQAILDLGPSFRAQVVDDHRAMLESGRIGPAERASIARILAEIEPERRSDHIAAVHSALHDYLVDIEERPAIAQALAEISDGHLADAVSALAEAAADTYVAIWTRTEAARILADLGLDSRRRAADILHELATDRRHMPWERVHAAGSLIELGPAHHAAAAGALQDLLIDSRANPWNCKEAAHRLMQLPAHHRADALAAIRSTPAATSDSQRIGAAVALATLSSTDRPRAVTELLTIIDDQLVTFYTRCAAAIMVTELGPEHRQMGCAALQELADTARGRYVRLLSAYYLALHDSTRSDDAAASARRVLTDPRLPPDVRGEVVMMALQVFPQCREMAGEHLLNLVSNHVVNINNVVSAVQDMATTAQSQRAKAESRLAAIAADPLSSAPVRIQASAAIERLSAGHRVGACATLHSVLTDPHTRPADRITAGEWLARTPSGYDPVISAMTAIINDGHTEATDRLTAAAILDRLQPQRRAQTAEMVRQTVAETPNSSVERVQAAQWLDRIRAPREEVVTALLGVLETATAEDALVAAAEELAKHDESASEAGAAAIRQRLADPSCDHVERCHLARALVELGAPHLLDAATALQNALTNKHLPTTATIEMSAALLQISLPARKTAADALTRLLARPDVEPAAQLAAIDELYWVPAAQPVAANAARHLMNDPRVGLEELVSAAEIVLEGDPANGGSAAQTLGNLLIDREASIKTRISAALAYAGAWPPARDRLHRQLDAMCHADEPIERLVGAVAWVRIHTPQPDHAIEIVGSLANDPSADVDIRWHAAYELTKVLGSRHVGGRALQTLIACEELTPADRCRIAGVMGDLGSTARDYAAVTLANLLNDTTLSSSGRRATALVMSRLSPVYRDVGAAHLHGLVSTTQFNARQHDCAIVDLASISPVYRQQRAELLLTQIRRSAAASSRQLRAATTLATISPAHAHQAAEVLLSIARNCEAPPAIRSQAASAIVERRYPGWRDAREVLHQLRDEQSVPHYIRRQATQALLGAGPADRQSSVATLARLCADTAAPEHDRLESALAVADFAETLSLAITTLTHLMTNADAPTIRRRAAVGLIARDARSVVDAAEVLREIHREIAVPAAVRTHAAADLGRLSPGLHEEATNLLARDLHDANPILRTTAARHLASFGHVHRQRAIRALDKTVNSTTAGTREHVRARRMRQSVDQLTEI